MRMIHDAGRGAVVYLRHEMAGTGLLQRLQNLHLTDRDAPVRLADRSTRPDGMSSLQQGAYGIGCQILRDLGIRKLRLITNHPFQPTALEGFGLTIAEFVPVKT